MRRLLGRIVHNWPLKLAAVGLATLMYGGLALSQNTQTFQGVIPARYVNEPSNTVITPSTPRPVTQVRYFAPPDVTVATSSFVATIDLSSIGTSTGVVSAPVTVTTPDNRVRVLGWEPTFVTIDVDKLISRNAVPIEVTHGPVPDGLTLGPTVVDPTTVTISGAQTLVDKVDSVRADVEPRALLCHFHALGRGRMPFACRPIVAFGRGAPPWLTSTAAARTISCH